ncbi:teichoic acid ABC transporter permease, partial [Staphylococcus aureus]|nr:teichoic acid ABC transporter permease [Staphylococcus aureus]
IYFLAESYRAAILFHEWYFIEHWKLLIYNVIVILIFFVLGSILHRRYRDHFADFL